MTLHNSIMPDFFSNRLFLTSLMAILLLIAIAWVAGRVQLDRRSRALVVALTDSLRGKVVVRRGPGASGFAGVLEPAPDPFVQFEVDYRTMALFDVPGHLYSLLAPSGDHLVLSGKLPTRPVAELVWRNGQIPGHALARRERSALWVQRRLEIVDAEFAVRGANTGAIEHVFVDLQARFRPFLDEISVQSDRDPEVTVALRLAGLNMQEIPALVTSVRTLGRAALRS
jgi:hypothetical protein